MNKVIMIGRVASDIELRSTQSGVQVAQYRLAVNRRKGKDGQQEADFFSCIVWDKGAAFASQYLTKGAKVGIVGHLQSRSYDAQDGSKRYVTEIIVDEHEFCESKGSSTSQAETLRESVQALAGGNSPKFEIVEDDYLPF